MTVRGAKSPAGKAPAQRPRERTGRDFLPIVDSRPEAAAQRTLQRIASESAQVNRLREIRAMAIEAMRSKGGASTRSLPDGADEPKPGRSKPPLQRGGIGFKDDPLAAGSSAGKWKALRTGEEAPVQRMINIAKPERKIGWHIAYFDYVYESFVKPYIEAKGPGHDWRIVALLKSYDLENKAFESPPKLLAALELDLAKQKAPDNSAQALLTEEHWKQKLIPKADGKDLANHFLTVSKEDYWQKYAEFADAKNAGAAVPKARTVASIVKDIGPDLLQELAVKGKASAAKLKIYRGMPSTEADAILNWFAKRMAGVEQFIQDANTRNLSGKAISTHLKGDKANPGILPIGGHMGDAAQASTYDDGDSKDSKDAKNAPNALLEFTLKPGAHELLFSPKYMAIARAGKGVTAMLAEHERQTTGRAFPSASADQGNAPGYIGMKSEAKGPFSLNMGESEATPLLFQLFVESVKKV